MNGMGSTLKVVTPQVSQGDDVLPVTHRESIAATTHATEAAGLA